MKLIVGLGNPGAEYARTRHNAGFLALDRVAARFATDPVVRSRFHAAALDASIQDEKCLLLKPMTYMNRSGLAVSEALTFFKLAPADLLVLVDDVAIPCGEIRIRPSGSPGGHNGLDDIQRCLGTDAYTRLRIGIDAPAPAPLREYVLGRFTDEQVRRIEPALARCVEAVQCWVGEGVNSAMNRFNKRNRPDDDSDPPPRGPSASGDQNLN